MKLNRQMFAMAAGLGLLSAGCLGAADDRDAEAVDALPSDVLSTNHHTGINGLNHDWFRNRRNNLYSTTGLELLVSNNTTLNSTISAMMCGVSPAGGPSTFAYAMQCGLPASYSVTCGDFTTGGLGHTPILNTTSGWLNGPLGSSARFDILACVAAHVNAYNVTIPLVLSGTPINDQHELGLNTFEEATWTAELDLSGAVKINVWPSAALIEYCGGESYAIQTLEDRICSREAGICYFAGRQNFETYCDPDPDPEAIGTYTCEGKAAITTWLNPSGVTTLHETCQIH